MESAPSGVAPFQLPQTRRSSSRTGAVRSGQSVARGLGLVRVVERAVRRGAMVRVAAGTGLSRAVRRGEGQARALLGGSFSEIHPGSLFQGMGDRAPGRP